jgi:flagellar motor switch protein FliN/FliY
MPDEKDMESPENVESSETSTPEEASDDAATPSSDADAAGVEADATPEGVDAVPDEDAAPPDEEKATPEDKDAGPDEDAAPPEEEKATPEDKDAGPDEDAAPPDEEKATPSADEILAEAGAVEDNASSPGADSKAVNEEDVCEKDAEAAMLAMLEEVPEDSGGATPEDINFDSASVSQAQFQQLSETAGQPEAQNIDMLLDINLPVSIELGRTRMSIADILALGPGSVVELNKLAGEPVDLLVNHKTVARGEVVVIDENFGVRITNLISPEERLKALGEEQ